MIRVAIDTNILAYAAGVARRPADHVKVGLARHLLDRLAAQARIVVPVQALSELFVVLTRAGEARGVAQDIVLRMHGTFLVPDSSAATLLSAMDAAVAHRLQLWDAMILTAAAEAGCTILLSEDMTPGFSWRGVTLVNPLVQPTDQRLAGLLAA